METAWMLKGNFGTQKMEIKTSQAIRLTTCTLEQFYYLCARK